MIIIDTTVWVDYFKGVANAETDWLDAELGRQPLAVTDLILCELLLGVRDDTEFRQVQRELLTLDVFDSGGKELAIAAAENYRVLRTKGFTIRKTIDCIIATLCLRDQHSLLHRDRDFDPFEAVLGLSVIHPEPLSEQYPAEDPRSDL